ncbi:MAG: formate--tetrahydrofolate ligase [Acidocella sp.]|nr:formate--tetrahydrofolate ligase [Acidocella sp.]
MSLALSAPTHQSTPTLADQLLSLRRRWRLILACTLIVPGLTLVVLLHLPVTYTATGIVLYDPGEATIPGDTSNAPQTMQDEDAVTASQGEIIASLPAAGQIATQLNLAARPEFNPALAQRHFPFSLLPRSAAPNAAALAEATRRALNITVLPGSRVLTVSFTSTDPALAATAANLAMQLYLNHERDQSFAALTDAQTWLEHHSEDVQAQLDVAETQLAQARAAAGVVQGAQANLTTETASRIAASLVEAQADLAMNQARLNAASGGDAAAANAAIAPNLLPLRKEQADLTAQVRSLSTAYGPDYPDLQTARAQLGAITSEINAETGRELDAARAEVAADTAQIATLQTALAAARTQSQTEDEESGPIRALEQRASAARDMLRAMTLQADQLAQDASLTKPDARILSTAAIPTSSSTPHKSLILGAALGLGLCAGVLLAGLAEALDTSFRSGEDIRTHFGLSCFSMVPETAAPRHAALEAPFSLYAEQLRALRTGLGFTPGQCRIVAITAARPGEGKTTLTITFARSLAAAGLRVLAIDGDIRQPSFDPVFDVAGAPWLTDHLAGLASRGEIFIQDKLSPLHVLPAGTQAKAALSLFLAPALPAFLHTLREDYDVVLIDVPPVFALAEGRVLARLADAALLCVRWGHTPRRVAHAAILLLQEAGVILAGAALTRVNTAIHGKSGYADAEIYQPRYGGYFKH